MNPWHWTIQGRDNASDSCLRWAFGRAQHLSLVLALALPSLVSALPSVEGVVVLSSTRVDRTVFEYKLALRVRGDSQSYADVKFDVSGGGPGTTIKKSLVQVGAIDAGVALMSQDTLVLRHDRTQAFDPSKLNYAFSGAPLPQVEGQAPLQVGPLVFIEESGRPLHRGSFAIQSDTPVAGSSPLAKVQIFGAATSVNYRTLSAAGLLLTQGTMQAVAGQVSPAIDYVTPMELPAQPFRVEITAVSPSGQPAIWKSARLFDPQPFAIRIEPKKALLAKGESVPMRLKVAAGALSGPLVVTLMTPAGFNGERGPWTLNLVAGTTTWIDTVLTAPTIGDGYDEYTLSVSAYQPASPGRVLTSDLQVLVK